MMDFESVIALILGIYVLYKLAFWNHDYFLKKGIKFVKPLPFIGSTADNIKGIGTASRFMEMYKAFPNEKVIGFFDFSVPSFLIRDPELMRSVMVKDFSHFRDRFPILEKSVESFVGSILASLAGADWKNMRTTLAPLFTGYRMKGMQNFVNECAQNTVDYIIKINSLDPFQPCDVTDTFQRFTGDTMASCTCGIDNNSLQDPSNDINNVFQNFLKIRNSFSAPKFLIMKIFPNLSKFLKITACNDEWKREFSNVIISLIEKKQREGNTRPDILQLLIKLKDGKLTDLQEDEKREVNEVKQSVNGEVKSSWTDTDIIAQIFMYFVGGYEAIASTITYAAYALAVHSSVQSRAYEEVQSVYKSLRGGSLSYEALSDLKYLGAVLNEVMRMWPPLAITDRKCIKRYKYSRDGVEFTLDEGDNLIMPLHAYHNDPKYFPDPEKFLPERYNESNKDNFFLFGAGPRMCIGHRPSTMIMKTLLFYVIHNFEITPCSKTDIPLKFKTSFLGFTANKNILLQFKQRTTNI